MIEYFLNNLKKLWMLINSCSGLISERVRVEIAIIKILHEIKEIDSRIQKLYEIIGKRFFELRDRHEKNILKDEEITFSLIEIQKLTEERRRLVETASRIAEVRDTEEKKEMI